MAERGCEGLGAVWWRIMWKRGCERFTSRFFVPIGLVCKMGCKMVGRVGMIMAKCAAYKRSTMFLWAVRRIL